MMPLGRTMDQMLERLAGNEFYCFLDGFSGYFQIPIDPQDQEKTTFTFPYGTFAYKRMPFGLCNAPGTFQRLSTLLGNDLPTLQLDSMNVRCFPVLLPLSPDWVMLVLQTVKTDMVKHDVEVESSRECVDEIDKLTEVSIKLINIW
ncbi:hypothetical protein Tco_1156102 [Tanacetum coccineum]